MRYVYGIFAMVLAVLFVVVEGQDRFRVETDVDAAVRLRREKSVKNISAEELNRIHLAIIARMMLQLPHELDLVLKNDGVIARDSGERKGLRGCGSIGNPISWSISGESVFVCFSFYVLKEKDDSAVATFQIDKQSYSVYVTHVDSYKEVTQKALMVAQPDLGGRSVKDVLKMLEGPPGDIESNEP